MNILMKMYQGSYVLENDKIGHEFINLIKSDSDAKHGVKYYIWLNSNGTFNKKSRSINMLMVKRMIKGVYKILGKATNCKIVPGANSDKKEYRKEEERYKAQSGFIKYSKYKLEEIHINEKNTLVTFSTTKVFVPIKPLYIYTTKNKSYENDKRFFRLNIKSRESMREYFDDNRKEEFNAILKKQKVWKPAPNRTIFGFIKKYSHFKTSYTTLFSITGNEYDEISISNTIYHLLTSCNTVGKFLHSLVPSIDSREEFKLYREKNHTDFLFISNKHIIIMENKIESGILYYKKDKKWKQNMLNKILNDIDIKKEIDKTKTEPETIKKNLIKLCQNSSNQSVSQLSKYYLIANAYKHIFNKQHKIICLLLTPNYNQILYPIDDFSLFHSKYKWIGYNQIHTFFKNQKIDNKKEKLYNDDFVKNIEKFTIDEDIYYESVLATNLKKRLELLTK